MGYGSSQHQHNGSSSCILRAFSLALCASMQSGNAVHAVSGDHFVPSMCQVAYSTMGVEERKLPGAVCCTSHHFISTKKIILIEPAERLLLLHQETRKPKQTKRRNQQASFRARTALGGRRKEKKGRIVS